jgi:hypothetical protein
MEKTNNTTQIEFTKAIFIISGLTLITGFFFGYKHYYDNAGKGIDDFLFAMSIYPLNSFFAAMGSLQYYKNRLYAKLWFTLGFVFTIICGYYIFFEIFNNDLLIAVIIAFSLPLISFLLATLITHDFNIVRVSIYIIYILTVISGGIPIFLLFILGTFSQLLKMFINT